MCAICASVEGSTLQVREMMFGTRECFDYFWCAKCGCCQLVTPVDTAAYYPSHYCGFHSQTKRTGLFARLRRFRNFGVFRGHFVGRLLNRFAPYYGDDWFTRMRVDRDSRILDVGCGTGQLVRDLRDAGFTRSEGIDPLIPDHVLRAFGDGVQKRWLSDVTGEYDLVMLHHVLEHMPDQNAALGQVARVLRIGGRCLIRIPVIPSYAWERYRENWVQLDAPRHLFVHSERSLAMVAERAGLELEHAEHDSTEFQFAGSDLYARGLPLSELPAAYSRLQLYRFRRDARRLNKARRGDQVAFYFRKTAPSAASTPLP
jgi:SAM-dependent methyltransferase